MADTIDCVASDVSLSLVHNDGGGSLDIPLKGGGVSGDDGGAERAEGMNGGRPFWRRCLSRAGLGDWVVSVGDIHLVGA